MMPKFVVKDMETLYIDEVRSSINLLISNLESVPVTPKGSGGGGSRKTKERSRSRYLRLYVRVSDRTFFYTNTYHRRSCFRRCQHRCRDRRGVSACTSRSVGARRSRTLFIGRHPTPARRYLVEHAVDVVVSSFCRDLA